METSFIRFGKKVFLLALACAMVSAMSFASPAKALSGEPEGTRFDFDPDVPNISTAEDNPDNTMLTYGVKPEPSVDGQLSVRTESDGSTKCVVFSMNEGDSVLYPGYVTYNGKKYDYRLRLVQYVLQAEKDNGEKVLFGVDLARNTDDTTQRKAIVNRIFADTKLQSTQGYNGNYTEAHFVAELYKAGTNTPAIIPNLYIGLEDFDLESIRFPGEAISPDVIYNYNAPAATLENTLFNESDQSFYNVEVAKGNDAVNTSSTIQAKVDSLSDTGILEFYMSTIGGSTASANIKLLAKQIPIHIVSDANGVGSVDAVVGEQQTLEDPLVAESQYPDDATIASITTPNTGYYLKNYTCDKQVTLQDSTVIPAGSPITPAQAAEIVPTEEITLTANHVKPQVNYASDGNGSVDKTSENVDLNGNPTGAIDTPNPGYMLTYWTTDKDVTLTNGDVIKAGWVITEYQIKQVVVDEATDGVVFTAYHEKIMTVTYTTDGHGTTSIDSEEVPEYNFPTGAQQTPNEGYIFENWTVDKEVMSMEDGGIIIPAGGIITEDQIKLVITTEDLTFTAHYTAMPVVNYTTDGNGSVDKASEPVAKGDSPTGATQTPNDGYIFKNWTADKDVTLKDSTVIKAGDPITAEQLKQIVVTEDIVFTAHYERNSSDDPVPANPTSSADPVPTKIRLNNMPDTSDDTNVALVASFAVMALASVLVSKRKMHQ